MTVVADTPYLGLFELMQVIELQRRDLFVSLRKEDADGFLHFTEGRLTHARLGILGGEDAFLRLAGWQDSECTLRSTPSPHPRTIRRETSELLFMALRTVPPSQPAPSAGWSVAGEAATLSLVELVQIFEMNLRPCRIEVKVGEEVKGELRMNAGQVLLPAGAEEAAEESLFELLGLEGASYRATPGPAKAGATRALPAAALIMEAMRRADESRLAVTSEAAERQARVDALLRDLDEGKLSPETRGAIAKRYLPGGETTPIGVLLKLAGDPVAEVRREALATIRGLPQDMLATLAGSASTPLAVLHEIVFAYPEDVEIRLAALEHPELTEDLAVEIAGTPEARIAAAVRKTALASSPAVVRALEEAAGPAAAGAAQAEEPEAGAGRKKKKKGRGRAKGTSLNGMPFNDRLYLATQGTVKQQIALVTSPISQIASAVVNSPRVTELLIETIAALPTANTEALREIVKNRRWTSQRSIARALAFNPKTPPSGASELLVRLSESDLRGLARNPGVSDVMRQAAIRRLAMLAAQRGER